MKRQKWKSYIHSPLKLPGIIRMISVVGLFSILCCQSPADTAQNPGDIPQDSLTYFSDLIMENGENSDALVERARLYHQQKSYAAALKDLEAALRLDSSQMETYLLKSRVELDYFRSLESMRTLRKAEMKWPESALIKEQLARTYLILKQYQQATEKAYQALEINPAAGRPYLLLGMIAKEKPDTASAIQHLQQAVHNDADLVDAWIELARIQAVKNPREAAKYFESALQIDDQDVLIWHAYAMYWQNRDSLEQSKNSYDQILLLDSTYLEAYYNKALILMDQDSFHPAISIWDHYTAHHPDDAKGYFYRGICRELTQQFDEALTDYRKAKALEPGLENIDDAIRSMMDRTGSPE